jgi:hypothetical protein
MKSAKRMVIFSAILLLASCSSVQPRSPLGRIKPLSSGEAKLTAIEMPEYVHEGLPYDVILDFSSDGPLHAQRVCFKWLAGRPSFATSSSDRLMGNADAAGTENNSPADTRFETTHPSSGLFCVETSHIRIKSPGKLIVRIRPEVLHADYTMLQAQVEYTANGKLNETNIVETPVKVDK